MIRVADLEGTTDIQNSHRDIWAAALLAAFIGGFSGTVTAIVLLSLFIPWPG
jgi:hypothetical protein